MNTVDKIVLFTLCLALKNDSMTKSTVNNNNFQYIFTIKSFSMYFIANFRVIIL